MDKTFSYEEGITKCNDNNPQVYSTGTWTFNSDETILIETTSGTDTPSKSTILTLSETQLVLSYTEEIDGLNYTFTATLAHP